MIRTTALVEKNWQRVNVMPTCQKQKDKKVLFAICSACKKCKRSTPTERLELSTLRSQYIVKVSRASQLCHAGWSGDHVIIATSYYYMSLSKCWDQSYWTNSSGQLKLPSYLLYPWHSAKHCLVYYRDSNTLPWTSASPAYMYLQVAFEHQWTALRVTPYPNSLTPVH